MKLQAFILSPFKNGYSNIKILLQSPIMHNGVICWGSSPTRFGETSYMKVGQIPRHSSLCEMCQRDALQIEMLLIS
jgi:hypothetical protein